MEAQDLADFLAVPVATIYGWRHRRTGPPGFRIGKHVRYRRSDIEQWIDHQLEDSARDPGSASVPRTAVSEPRTPVASTGH